MDIRLAQALSKNPFSNTSLNHVDIVRWLTSIIFQAQNHIFKGKIDEALEILWDMRLKPDLGLYRRALMNLLITCNADIEVHNCSEFAQGRLELLKQLERDGIPPNEGTHLIEKHAYEILKAIEMEEVELEKVGNEGEDEGEVATGAFKRLEIGEHSGTEGQMEIDGGDDLRLSQMSSSRAKSTSAIEGMYTDDYGIKTKAEESAQLMTLASKPPLRKRQA